MLGRIKQTDIQRPVSQGRLPVLHAHRGREAVPDYIPRRKKGNLDAAEEVLLDVNKLAEGQKFISVGAYAVSDDANLLAYRLENGYRQYKLHVKDLATGKMLTERIERVGARWAKDNKTLFYTTEDAPSGSTSIPHVLGEPEPAVYEEKDELFDVSVALARRAIIFIDSARKTTNECGYHDGAKPTVACGRCRRARPATSTTSSTAATASTS